MDKSTFKSTFVSPVVPGQTLYLKTRNDLPCMIVHRTYENKKQNRFWEEQFILLHLQGRTDHINLNLNLNLKNFRTTNDRSSVPFKSEQTFYSRQMVGKEFVVI